MEQNNEVWYDVPGYEGLYQFSVTNSITGKVRSIERTVPNKRWGAMTIKERILRPGDNTFGYLYVILSKNGKRKIIYIHQLVARQLVHNPDPDNLIEINHINEDKHDNRPSNLEWCTSKYNVNFGTRNQRVSVANTNNPSISKPIRCIETNVIYPSTKEAERQLGIWQQNISCCANGKLKSAGGYHWEYV